MRAAKALFYRELRSGLGAPVVLSHALGLDHTMWLGVVDKIITPRPIIAFDHRGHGRSPWTSSCSMQDLVDDAASLLALLTKNRGPVTLLGISMGAMVGQGLAICHPELIHGLILAHTSARYPDAAKLGWADRVASVQQGGLAAVVELVVQRYLTEKFRLEYPQLAHRLREIFLSNDPASYAACCQAVANVDWLAQLERIATPVLVLAGEHDKGATPEMAQAIHERIELSQIEIISEASHLSPWENAADFALVINRFISKL